VFLRQGAVGEGDVGGDDFHLLEGAKGGELLGFFFAGPPAAGEASLVDDDADFEALAVVGSFFVEEFVAWGGVEGALGVLLEHAFEVALMLFGVSFVKEGPDEIEDELAGGFDAAVEIDGTDERFEGGGTAGGGQFSMIDHSFSDAEEAAQADVFGDVGTGAAGDNHALDFGELAFEVAGKASVEFGTDDHTEDGVAKEFESFVAFQGVVGG